MPTVFELQGITKRFPGVLANDHIHLTLEQGEVHALLGENGAGKTTLMNILYGLYTPDEGTILVHGSEAKITSPEDALRLGIGMVHQHFMLVPPFTVTENVMLGVETLHYGLFLDRESVARRIRDIADQYGLQVDPAARVQDLSVGAQQRVEIVKILYRQANILILDEPTAVLTPQEVEDLFKVIRELVARGVSVIFISHKLKEVMDIADRITVLRDGKVVGTTRPADTSLATLARMMVGREVILTVDKAPARMGPVVLEIKDLQVRDDRKQMAVNGLSLEVRAGEILGVAGVQGNGQTELVEGLTGLRPVSGGEVHILGHDTTHASPRRILEQGVAHIPEDRQRDGLVLSYPVADNLVLNTYYLPPFARGMELQAGAVLASAAELVRQFDIRTPSVLALTSGLSGGNQQKVIVAREFSRPIQLLIASQPTRGLDVGSIEYIHQRLVEKRDQGCAVLLVSPELDEIMSLSDRIAVMFRGQIIETVVGGAATPEQLGLLMAGIHPGEERVPAAVPA